MTAGLFRLSRQCLDRVRANISPPSLHHALLSPLAEILDCARAREVFGRVFWASNKALILTFSKPHTKSCACEKKTSKGPWLDKSPLDTFHHVSRGREGILEMFWGHPRGHGDHDFHPSGVSFLGRRVKTFMSASEKYFPENPLLF